jgi:small GTP-binding protein
MSDKNAKIEKRLSNMKDFYLRTNELIDNIPDAIPEDIKKLIKDKILGDKDLKNLMDGIDDHRPPRIFLIGRTGVGKSSLINALCGSYVADVSDVKSCTQEGNFYECKDGNRVLMEIFDTRGIAESETMNERISAENQLIDQVNEFSPDVAIFMLNCTHRDDVDDDVEFLKKVAKKYESINKLRLPIVVVVNKCDEMAPARHKDPAHYPDVKKNKIDEVVRYYKEIIVKHNLKIEDIIGVSSLIDWQTADGIEIDVESICNLPKADISNLEIAFDGRYRIEDLLDILEKAILDFEAQMGLRMALRLDDLVHRISKHLTKVFAGISATVAVSPIPLSDIYILVILQTVLVALIAALSGREVTLDSAKEFVFSLCGVAGGGFMFRLLAQQTSKLINFIWPGAGSAVSSGVAFAGTTAMGKAAIAYYIDGTDLDQAKKIFKHQQEVSSMAMTTK